MQQHEIEVYDDSADAWGLAQYAFLAEEGTRSGPRRTVESDGSISATADLYAHLIGDLEQEAADEFDRALTNG